MAEEKLPSEVALDLLAKWNPPPEDKAMERVVGVPTEPGDVAATAHVRDENLQDPNEMERERQAQVQASMADDGDDDDTSDGGVKDVKDMTGPELKDEIDALNAERDQDNQISKSGKVGTLRKRVKDARNG